MGEHFFESLLAIMGISLGLTVLLRRLQLPSIIAYLLAGTLIGPHVLGWIQEPGHFTFLAEFGVVFLLFSLGLEFSLPRLMALRHSVFGLGSIQVLFCTLIFGGSVWLWGTSVEAAILIAGALALSSTAIVSKELSGLHQLHRRHGQLAIGVLLFQDLAAVVFLILVPVLSGASDKSLWYALGGALAKGVMLMVILLGCGKWLLPPLYKEVSRARSEEIFVLTTLVIVMLAAWITHSFHLSMALGGFVIGMMLGESSFRHQIEADIRPFKDILLGLFFVTIGMTVDVNLMWEYWPRLILFTIGLLLIKTVLITALVKMSGNDRTTALQTGLNLAQAGEFGLALLALAVMQNVVPNDQASFIILVCIFSMVASPFLIRHSEPIAATLWRWLGLQTETNEDVSSAQDIPSGGHVIIGGYGRVGQTITRLLELNQLDYIAIDQDIDLVSRERRQGTNVIYGDCSKLEILKRCHLDQAQLAILTFGSIEYAKRTIEHIRADGVNIPIIVRCQEHGDFKELIALGANYVVPEMLEASLMIASQVLNLLGINPQHIENQVAQERDAQLQQSQNNHKKDHN